MKAKKKYAFQIKQPRKLNQAMVLQMSIGYWALLATEQRLHSSKKELVVGNMGQVNRVPEQTHLLIPQGM